MTCVELQNSLAQPVQVFLNGSTTIWCITHFSQFCVVCLFDEGALCPVIQLINEDLGAIIDPWGT